MEGEKLGIEAQRGEGMAQICAHTASSLNVISVV